MSSKFDPETKSEPIVYQIRIEGHLGRPWANWFGGLTITLEENGDTLVTGPVVDQAALFGFLRKVRDLGMPLVSVHRLGPGPSAPLPSASLGTGGTGQAGASEVKR
jgi:hypothetical protein